ncbi:hypothetical protein [Marivita sp.]|uniref:hypothetical protein n=1 Tax=Marivita sp. TaxID=2003365 RepID=UPI0025C14077|nr:hypothetical protein [Marivita sp.]
MPEVTNFTGIQSGFSWPVDSNYGVPVVVISPDLWDIFDEAIRTSNPDLTADSINFFQNNMVRASADERAAIRDAISNWEILAGIQIVEVGYGFSDPAIDQVSGIGIFFGSGDGFPTQTTNAQFPNDNIAYIYFSSEYSQPPGEYIWAISVSLGLKPPDFGDVTLVPNLDNQDITLMSQNGPWTNTQPRPLDIEAMQDLYGIPGSPNNFVNRLTSSHELIAINDAGGDLAPFLQNLRDFGGNTFGSAGDWTLLGEADVQGDGDIEAVIINSTLGRWGTLGPDELDIIDFLDHGAGGDTRVVGTYIDPLVAQGQVEAGSDFDSQVRFANDLRNANFDRLLGADDYDGDGFQELYMSTADGTAYLHAYMHADGNIRYANYQSEEQMIDFLVGLGFQSDVWGDWI